jgi:hypothetical protein
MAAENPTVDPRFVPVDLPSEQMVILRSELVNWLAGVRDDLEAPEKLRDPERSLREAATYERLLAGLEDGKIRLPDEEARSAIEAAAEVHDETNN